MRILHLIPVGRSLLDQIARGVLPGLQTALAADELPGAAVHIRDALAQSTAQDHELDLDRLGLAGVSQAAADAHPSMAAEWTSVKAVAEQPGHGAVDGEAYVFIATDSADGLRAAVLVAARYQHTAIHYLHEPLAVPSPRVKAGDAYVCRIPDLDLGTREPTSATWRSLGAVGRLVADTGKQTGGGGEWGVVVHLSGGYKAMIPYVMVLAEGIRSRLRDSQTTRAVATHDPSAGKDPTISRIVIDIPVRAIKGDYLRADVEKLKKLAQPDSDVVGAGAPKDLLGLFIEREDSAYRLTPPGLIMVNVL